MTAPGSRHPRLALGLVPLLFFAFSPPASAQEDAEFNPLAAERELEALAERLDAEEVDAAFLNETRTRAAEVQDLSEACVERTRPQVERLEEQRDIFKDATPDIDPENWEQRLQIQTELTAARARLSYCTESLRLADNLLQNAIETQAELSARYLWQRGRTVVGLVGSLPETVRQWPQRLRESAALELDERLSPVSLLIVLVVIGVIAVSIGLVIRLRFMRWFQSAGGAADPPRLKFLFPKPLAQWSPLLLEGLALTVTLYFTIDNASLDLAAVRLALALLFYGIGCVVIDWATGPLSPAAKVHGLVPDHVLPLRRRLRLFIVSLVASFVIIGREWLSARADIDDELVQALLLLAVAMSLLVVLAYLRKIPGLQGRFRIVRLAGVLAVITALVALALGYQHFAAYLIHGAVRTSLALIVLWILLWLVLSGFESLVEGEAPLARQVRSLAGLRDGDRNVRTTLGFMQLVTDVMLWLGFTVYLIYVWDSSGNTLDQLSELVMEGKRIGNVELVPVQIVVGILVFAALIVLVGWIKRWVDRRWLRHMALDRGARDALVTLFGYIGFIAATVIGLNLAGIDLTGLAIVGGALALGIGFGLQAIASNFVSGLILLFERPIKAGDFVTVGGTEGFVRRIRIRATEIETLDNQNVLVPNSELVSGRVTNWVFRNPQGRLQILVGVAYGSDVELVRELLETVATEHSEVISDGSAPPPRALFMGFGDSSLDFELRVRIKRIERRYTVISDINFAIDRAFRENGVTIPFPQRDLHVVSLPEPEETKAAVTPVEQPVHRPVARDARRKERMTRSHSHEVELETTLEAVWAAITDDDWLEKWAARDAKVNPRIGGDYRLVLEDDRTVTGRIDIFMPPRRLRVVLQPGEGDDPLATGPITEEYFIDEGEEAVKLTVKVGGIPASEDWEQYYRQTEDRWDAALKELARTMNSSVSA